MQRERAIFGFSLVELILVIAILSILAVPIYFRWSGSFMTLTSQAQILANNLRYTQNLSMAQHQRFSLVRLSATSYQIQDAAGQAVRNPLDSEIVTLTSGVTFGTFQAIANRITFSSEGVPFNDSATPAPLITTAELPMILDNRTEVVTVSPETGMVTP